MKFPPRARLSGVALPKAARTISAPTPTNHLSVLPVPPPKELIETPRVYGGHRLAVLHLHTPNISSYGDVSLRSKIAYANKWGFSVVAFGDVLDGGRPPVWSKIRMCQSALENFDWVWWLDADAVITNFDSDIRSRCLVDSDLLIARDQNDINAGSFLLQKGPATQAFLAAVCDRTDCLRHRWQEQEAMRRLLVSGYPLRVGYVDKREINSYPSDWCKGDLVIHLPDCSYREERLRGHALCGSLEFLHFMHAGDLGDIVYSLPTVRALCRAHGKKAVLHLSPKGHTREPMTAERAEVIAPLLRTLPYVEWAFFDLRPDLPAQAIDGNHLDGFRETWRRGGNLSHRHLSLYNLDWKECETPWIDVPARPTSVADVLIARTGRYDTKFPWSEVVARCGDSVAFLGHRDEHREFCRQFGYVPYYWTANLAEATKVIAGSSLFVGSATSLTAIAIGMGQLTVVGTHGQDVIFNRKGIWNVQQGCGVPWGEIEAEVKNKKLAGKTK